MSCRYLSKNKEPRCGCFGCWVKYFSTNVGKAAAWVAILELHGFKYLEGAKGTKFVKMLRRYYESLHN